LSTLWWYYTLCSVVKIAVKLISSCVVVSLKTKMGLTSIPGQSFITSACFMCFFVLIDRNMKCLLKFKSMICYIPRENSTTTTFSLNLFVILFYTFRWILKRYFNFFLFFAGKNTLSPPYPKKIPFFTLGAVPFIVLQCLTKWNLIISQPEWYSILI